MNPNARGGRARALATPIRNWLAAHSPATRFIEAQSIEHTRTSLIETPSESRVVIIGGDGTVHQALPAILERNHTLGIVPFGSGDDAARAIGVHGMQWHEALRFALTESSSRIDIGIAEFNKQRVPFIVCMNAGLDAAVTLRAINGPKFLHGLPRYLLATLREIATLRMWPIDVRLDGELVKSGDALFTSALNTPSYGSGMPAVPHARIDDGTLNMLHASRCSRLQTLLLLPRLLAGTHLTDSRVSTQTFNEMQLRSVNLVPLAADGEYLGEAKQIRICTHHAALSVIRRAGKPR
ncbi:MAG: diacylglycerol/lipid kinase family protein [Casimicrobium sp.]